MYILYSKFAENLPIQNVEEFVPVDPLQWMGAVKFAFHLRKQYYE